MGGRVKLESLTSLRFVAAFWVVLYHTMPQAGRSGFAIDLTKLGYSAVTLFFMLSGFILMFVYRRFDSRAAITRFLVARIARIYPMFALSLLIDLPRLALFRIAKYGLVVGAGYSGVTLAAQLSLLQSWYPPIGALNYPSWSVSTELFFYLAFPFLLPLVARVRATGAIIAAMVALWAVLVATGILLDDHTPYGVGDLWRNPALRLPEFMLGMFLTQLIVRDGRLVTTPPILALPALASIGAVALLIHDLDGRIAEVVLLPGFALLIAVLASASGPLARITQNRTAVLLGEASYALYLLHAPFSIFYDALGVAGLPGAYLGYLAVTIAASVAAHLWFERPMRVRIVTWWDRRSAARRAAPLEPASQPAG